MSDLARMSSKTYHGALRLYPRCFREEYGQEMATTFTQSCQEASQVSTWAVWKLCLHELHDLPANLFKEHLAELWRGMMALQTGQREPKLKSILQGAIAFGVSFTLIYLLYSLLDSILNFGRTFQEDITIWKTLYLNPTALACGIGAIILGFIINKRRAWISAILSSIGYTLVSLTLSFLLRPPLTAEPGWFYFLVAPLIYAAIAGTVVGGSIGFSQRGWGKTGWYALAGAIGFSVGWFLDRLVAAAILQISPYGGYIVRVVIGSPWYFGYLLVPVLLYGLSIGLAMGVVAAYSGEGKQIAPV